MIWICPSLLNTAYCSVTDAMNVVKLFSTRQVVAVYKPIGMSVGKQIKRKMHD